MSALERSLERQLANNWDGCAQAVKNACKSQQSGMVFESY